MEVSSMNQTMKYGLNLRIIFTEHLKSPTGDGQSLKFEQFFVTSIIKSHTRSPEYSDQATGNFDLEFSLNRSTDIKVETQPNHFSPMIFNTVF